jgi:hypothetical protein
MKRTNAHTSPVIINLRKTHIGYIVDDHSKTENIKSLKVDKSISLKT